MDERVKEEVYARAALYALGALTQHDARAFEAQMAGDAAASAELRNAFENVVELLGLAAPEAAPSLSVKDALLTRIALEEQDVSKDVFSIRVDEGEWVEVINGIKVKELYADDRSGYVTSLVRMAAGGRLPPHRHIGTEQFYVIEGDCYVHGVKLGPGDYHRAPAGSTHESTYTDRGTLLLLIAPRYYLDLRHTN